MKDSLAKQIQQPMGDFTMDVFIKDEELVENPDGSFFIGVNEESLSGDFPKSELLDNSNFIDIQTEKRIENILSRDTIFNYNINIPKKETIKIIILNFLLATSEDYISISNYFPNDQQSLFNGQSSYSFFDGSTTPISKDIIGGRDVLNTIYIWKSNNGELTSEMVEILFEENNSTELVIEY